MQSPAVFRRVFRENASDVVERPVKPAPLALDEHEAHAIGMWCGGGCRILLTSPGRTHCTGHCSPKPFADIPEAHCWQHGPNAPLADSARCPRLRSAVAAPPCGRRPRVTACAPCVSPRRRQRFTPRAAYIARGQARFVLCYYHLVSPATAHDPRTRSCL